MRAGTAGGIVSALCMHEIVAARLAVAVCQTDRDGMECASLRRAGGIVAERIPHPQAGNYRSKGGVER